MGVCFMLLAVISAFLVIFKLWLKYVVAWDRSHTCLVGKTAIVTGANTGIGYHTALDFAKRGARVILACRNEAKAEDAKSKIIEASGNQKVVVKLVDFSSLASVRSFAKEINATEERLDILVNNAGMISLDHVTTTDGFDLIMQTNYFSPFLLTNLLTGLLKKSAPSRIVNVSSVGSFVGKVDINNINTFTNGIGTYACSKLCNILFSNEIARKLKGTGVTSNSLHPGNILTEIGNSLPGIVRIMMQLSINPFLRTSMEGAQTSIYLSVSKDVEKTTGEYYDNCRTAWLPPTAKLALDEGLAKKLWEKSEELVKLSAEERQL